MTETTVWKGRFLETVVDGRWEYVRRARGIGAAVILAVTDANEIVLVEQYRVPLGTSCLELPAGLVGDDGPEETLAAARRELEEETGFRAETLEDMGVFTSSPGMTSEHFTLVRAKGLVRVGPGGGIDSENITVHCVPLPALPAFIADKRRAGMMIDVRLLAAMTLL
ncbi:NUDIX hydrolase [Sphingosinicella soli]|uniref:GDP-mannose pyrophosphatase n=1 Tax=Sphingosinicella soli TaxID=333708 RepID=A0A7W7B2X6_9SPHN|nr:NUDIX hydrolase [Sphingosinicella soli]MBB4633055.1 ADP-ribose pyrophosphatase [Sphingosinicella soli]